MKYATESGGLQDSCNGEPGLPFTIFQGNCLCGIVREARVQRDWYECACPDCGTIVCMEPIGRGLRELERECLFDNGRRKVNIATGRKLKRFKAGY